MQTIDLNLLETLALATALFFVGQLIVRRSAFLQRYSIPVPVVGGVLCALVLAAAALVGQVQFTFNDAPKDPLLLAFFATLGLGADVRSLARGGWKLVILLGLFVAMMIMQCAIGVGMARAARPAPAGRAARRLDLAGRGPRHRGRLRRELRRHAATCRERSSSAWRPPPPG